MMCNDPNNLFRKPDRVRLSPRGVRHYVRTPPDRLGTVEDNPRKCFVNIRWDGCTAVQYYDYRFLEKVDART